MNTLFPTKRSAVISECGKYRYALWRTWDESKPPVCWIMFNPSTADAQKDDPTIRRCCGFARAWGAGGIVVVNLFAYRSTEPRRIVEMIEAGREDDAVGPNTPAAIQEHALEAGRVIAAWGAIHRLCQPQESRVAEMLRGKAVECLALTKHGQPWHPLYVANATVPIHFSKQEQQ